MNEKEEALKEICEQEVIRKSNAEKILNNPFHDWAFGVVEMKYYDEISSTEYDEKDKREDLYRKMKAIKDVKKLYEKALQDGKLAENRLNMLQKAGRATKKVLQM